MSFKVVPAVNIEPVTVSVVVPTFTEAVLTERTSSGNDWASSVNGWAVVNAELPCTRIKYAPAWVPGRSTDWARLVVWAEDSSKVDEVGTDR